MEDLRLWFLETRICRLWPNITEESWMEFMAEENRKHKKLLLEFLDSSHNHDILYFTRSVSNQRAVLDYFNQSQVSSHG